MQLYKSKAELFLENFNNLKSEFKFEYRLVLMFGAMMYINAKKTLDTEAIKDSKKFLKEKTSMFSSFRGINEFILSLVLSLQPNPEDFFEKMVKTHKKMLEKGFKDSHYLPMAALNIVKDTKGNNTKDILDKMMAIYKQMKAHHFWLTSHDDYVYAAILAITPFSVEQITEQSEYFYKELHANGFSKNNALQSLSHVLALSEIERETKRNRILTLRNTLKAKGYNIKYHGLPMLGTLSILGKTPEKLADSAIHLSEWLKKKKGFGNFSIDKNMRFSISAGIITDYHIDDYEKIVEEAVLSTTLQSLIIAQNIATTTAVIAATSSNSGSY